MYETSFGLKRRPFAATPDATCFLSAGPIQGVLDELVVCVEQGQGIGVVTAPAGTGKTLLCERLRFELDDRYETVLLRHASFLTRRALLQTILCELNYAYHHPSEQELRLELFPAIRALQPKREALVLICDEAHQLTDSLLEELRILADFAEFGRPLVRLVLVGQLSLEEKLAQPNLEAFNQRIRAHVSLSTFDHAGSLDYIDYRITWAGGRTDEVFTPDALDLISRASDGVPRCINQLADHSLLLAFVADQRPAGEDLVREALSDLRQLPLHWNEPSQSLSSSDRAERIEYETNSNDNTLEIGQDHSGYLADSSSKATSYSYEPEFDSNKSSVGLDSTDSAFTPPPVVHDVVGINEIHSTESPRVEVSSDDWRQTVELFNPRKLDTDLVDTLQELVLDAPEAEFGRERSSNLTRRVHFHDLLQDAYEAASKSQSDPIEQGESTGDLDRNADTVDISSEYLQGLFKQNEIARSSPTMASDSNPVVVQSTSDFQEEVIVDRYNSIDAGFEPPKSSLPDTSRSNEVRDEYVSASEVPDEAATHRIDFESSAADGLSGFHSSGNEFDESSIDEESTSYASVFRADSHAVGGFNATSEQNVPSWGDADLSDTSSPQLKSGTTNPSGVEQIAKDVYSLGESLRSTGKLSSNSDSILKTLRYEIEGSDIPFQAESTPQPPPVPPQAAWEAIETPVVEPAVVEERPFRYLFSALRRKQQGLS